MKKNYTIFIFLTILGINSTFSQVGIGTIVPDAQLDIRSSNQVTPANNDGILIPKVDAFPLINPTIAQQSMLVYLTTATTFSGNPKPIGFYYWNNPTTDWIGISSTINGDHDWYEVGTTLSPDAITDDMFHTGNVAIGKNTTSAPLDLLGTNVNTNFNIQSNNSISDGTVNNGILNSYSGTSTDNVNIIRNTFTGSSSGNVIGNSVQLNTSGTNPFFGSYNVVFGAGTGSNIAIQNSLGSSSGNNFGVRNLMQGSAAGGNYTGISSELYNNTGNGLTRGIYNQLGSSGTGSITGIFNDIFDSGTGIIYGINNSISNTGNGIHYGTNTILTGTGTGIKYGDKILVNTAAGGTHYGIFSEVLKPGATNFAGYFLGNVGIGTTGANMYTLPPSRGTNGQVMQTNGTGVVTWQNPGSFSWLTTGNAGLNGGNTVTAGTNFLGTTDNQNIDFRTNGIFRARLSNLGEFFVGTLNTILAGDLCNAVGNVTFPWALNGYSDFNGAGTYGQVTSGTTIFAGVQGEYNGTNTQGAGVRGLSLNATAGTSFAAPHTGVSGNATTAGTYKFGVYGSGGTTTRTGGVLGYDYGIAIGGLGYYSSGGLDYSVYGFGQAHTNGVAGGRLSNNSFEKNTNIGLGIYGGVMGGWVKGLKFGFHTKGETYSLYVDGNGYTNKPLTYLIPIDEQNKVASFMSTSLKPEVTVNGKTNLENGKVFVVFDRSFQQIINNVDDVIITATPQGKSNGIYIDTISKDGFWIYENNDGNSNVKISWIAITKIKGEENPIIPSELMANDFDKKMDAVMFNDNDTINTSQSLWWDGTKIRWDKPINDKRDTETEKLARPKGENK